MLAPYTVIYLIMWIATSNYNLVIYIVRKNISPSIRKAKFTPISSELAQNFYRLKYIILSLTFISFFIFCFFKGTVQRDLFGWKWYYSIYLS